jgi:D-alanyl-lipoteichoic acid acyltransferase DltB (MBOAT superfamily)
MLDGLPIFVYKSTMSFVSWQYALFLPLVFLIYWRLPWRGRICLLVFASYFFYGFWDARFLALLLTSTTIDFYCGLAMSGSRTPLTKVILTACLPVVWLGTYRLFSSNTVTVNNWIIAVAGSFPVFFSALYAVLWRLPEGRQRRAFLLLSVLTNLAVLGFFKYFNFFAASAAACINAMGGHASWSFLNIILPVGISFYTFQSISYSVEVYKGTAQPARDLLLFAAYLSFFPQLVAGPIERPHDLLPQLAKPAQWDIANFHRGIALILVGLFKKVFVADNCALLANYAFDPKVNLNAEWALLGALAFAAQIYGDFSGYTDIARGSARLLGIHLNHNFHFPYFSRSPSEFWQRWHITLSKWFRDYVYIPLGGNRGGTWLTVRNLWITMLLAGLWHGASWTFVLWGAYFGALLMLYRVTPALKWLAEPETTSRARIFGSRMVMFAFILIGWVIFRSRDMGQLSRWFEALGHWHTMGATRVVGPYFWLVFHAAPLLLLQAFTWKYRDEVELGRWAWPARGFAYSVLFLAVATSTVTDVEFIYFQF